MGLELISIFDLVHLADSKQVTRGKTGSHNNIGCASVLHKQTWIVASVKFASSFHAPLGTRLCPGSVLIQCCLILMSLSSFEMVALIPDTGAR